MFPFAYTQTVRPRTLLSVVLFMLLGTTVVGAETIWEKEKVTDDGISVYSRTTTGTTVREVRARMSINAPAKTVFEAVLDPKTFKDTSKKYVAENVFYHTNNPNIWYNYQLLDLPVIANRDYCLRYEKITDIPKGVFRITWRASDRCGRPSQEDVVRVSNIKGSFEVTAANNGKGTTLKYTLLADPGGNIPVWLINFANRRSLPNILRQVQVASLERVKQGRQISERSPAPMP